MSAAVNILRGPMAYRGRVAPRGLTGARAAWQLRPRLSATEEAPSDDARFAAAAREHAEFLRGLARRLCRDDAEASDLVQDTFERALRAWSTLPAGANVRAWLVTIQHNLFIDRCRRRKSRGTVQSIEDVQLVAEVPPPPAAWQQISAEQVQAAMANLPAEFRQVYALHSAGKSYDELARELGIPKNTVGTRLLRARKKLRELLMAGKEGAT